MDRAEAIAVKWASQSMGDTMDLAAEIRLAISEASEAAANEMREMFIRHTPCINIRGEITCCFCGETTPGKMAWEKHVRSLPLPTRALKLTLIRERLEEHITSCEVCRNLNTRHMCSRKGKIQDGISALEQAQREGKKYSAGGVRITDDCATVESITEV